MKLSALGEGAAQNGNKLIKRRRGITGLISPTSLKCSPRGMKLSALGEGKELHVVHYEKALKNPWRIHVRLSRQLFCQIKK
jgi:hypothetical protein